MIDFLSENLVPLGQVHRLYPQIFGSARSVHRAASDGSYNVNKSCKVMLGTIKTPSGRKTSHEEINRYVQAINNENGQPIDLPPTRIKQLQAVDNELAALGFA